MTELKDFMISADGALEKYIGRENRVIVPEGVRSALADAFCGSDTAFLSLPASFSYEDISFIDGILALEEISVHPENPVFSSLDGVLYNKDKTELLCCPPKKTGELIIPNTVLRFSGSAFKNCALLESIRISESVTEIGMGDGLFGCYAEISVDSGNPSFLSHGGIVYSIDEETVVLCSRGKTGEIYIPHSVSAVGCSAFAFCDRLTAIRFGTDVELCLGDNAFLGCSALSELRIPQNSYGNTEYMSDLSGLSVSVVVDGSYLCPEFSIRSGIFERVKSIYFTASYEEAISTELLKLYLEETEGEASLYFTDANGGYTPFLPPTDENGNYKLPTGFVIVRGELVEYNGREREVRIPSDGSVTSLGSSLFDCW